MITAEQFKAAVGRDPENDDLERSNCECGGEIGHYFCGWDEEANLPRFLATPHKLVAEKNRCSTIVMREIEYEGRPRNFYEPPFIAMVHSGKFWRCPHGMTRFAEEGGCEPCKAEWIEGGGHVEIDDVQ